MKSRSSYPHIENPPRLSCSLVLGFAIVFTGTGTSIAQCPTPSFGTPNIFPAGDGPIAVAVGVKEGFLAVVNANSHDVSIFFFGGGFFSLGPYPTEAEGVGGLAV